MGGRSKFLREDNELKLVIFDLKSRKRCLKSSKI